MNNNISAIATLLVASIALTACGEIDDEKDAERSNDSALKEHFYSGFIGDDYIQCNGLQKDSKAYRTNFNIDGEFRVDVERNDLADAEVDGLEASFEDSAITWRPSRDKDDNTVSDSIDFRLSGSEYDNEPYHERFEKTEASGSALTYKISSLKDDLSDDGGQEADDDLYNTASSFTFYQIDDRDGLTDDNINEIIDNEDDTDWRLVRTEVDDAENSETFEINFRENNEVIWNGTTLKYSVFSDSGALYVSNDDETTQIVVCVKSGDITSNSFELIGISNYNNDFAQFTYTQSN